MARIQGNPMMAARKAAGEVVKEVNDFTAEPVVSTVLHSELNKLWRAKILIDRATRPAKQGSTKNTLNPYEKVLKKGGAVNLLQPIYQDNQKRHEPQSPSVSENKANKVKKETESELKYLLSQGANISMISSNAYFAERNKLYTTQIQNARKKFSIGIFNTNTGEILKLQTMPKEVDFQGESTWAAIKSMGRNTPMYHFTGAESVIRMNVSWYCNDPKNPKEVVNNCRVLEAWSKSNGYTTAPPILKLFWGSNEAESLFDDQLFILTSATYVLSQWKNYAGNARMDRNTLNKLDIPVSDLASYDMNDPNLYPSVATQELEFKRVSSTNLVYPEIYNIKYVGK